MINVTKKEWAGTRQELTNKVNAFRVELENHRNTEGVPAPLSDNILIEKLASTSESFFLEDELNWVWISNGVGKIVNYRRLDLDEQPGNGETEVDFEPFEYVLEEDGSIRTETEEEKLYKEKIKRQSYINVKRNTFIASGVEFNGWSFDSDNSSIDNLTAAVAFIKSAPDANLTPPSTISWRDGTNVDRDLTVAQLIGLGAAVFQKVQEAHFKARMLKDAIEICTSLEEVSAIDW
jgi:hypothetical protein